MKLDGNDVGSGEVKVKKVRATARKERTVMTIQRSSHVRTSEATSRTSSYGDENEGGKWNCDGL
jgi:hypothetical protein